MAGGWLAPAGSERNATMTSRHVPLEAEEAAPGCVSVSSRSQESAQGARGRATGDEGSQARKS